MSSGATHWLTLCSFSVCEEHGLLHTLLQCLRFVDIQLTQSGAKGDRCDLELVIGRVARERVPHIFSGNHLSAADPSPPLASPSCLACFSLACFFSLFLRVQIFIFNFCFHLPNNFCFPVKNPQSAAVVFLKALNPKLPQDVAAPLQSICPKKLKAETRYVCTHIHHSESHSSHSGNNLSVPRQINR